MLTKYASAEVLDARLARQGAGLVKDAHRHEFDYEPRPGFLYVRSRAISSRTNDNFDHFPAEEIKKAYRTFIGKPVFVNHHNDNHRRARGVIVDAALHEDVNPDGSEDTWAEVLMEVDAVRFPKLAQAILAGEVDRTSMGTDVAFSVCSVCNNKATTPVDYCQHIPKMKGMKMRRRTASGDGTEEVLVYEKCYGLKFFENSLLVEEPADPTAFFLGVDDRGLQQTASRRVAAEAREPKVGMRFLHRRQIDGDRKPVEMVVSAIKGTSVYYKPVGHQGAGFVADVSRFHEEVGSWVDAPTAAKPADVMTERRWTETKPDYEWTRESAKTPGGELTGKVNRALGSDGFRWQVRLKRESGSSLWNGDAATLAEAKGEVEVYFGSSQARSSRTSDHQAPMALDVRTASRRTALEDTAAPAQVDTLRDESCPVCGEADSYDGDSCMVCGFIKPPDEFMEPDLEKAQEIDLRQEQDAIPTDDNGDPLEGEDLEAAEMAAEEDGLDDEDEPPLEGEDVEEGEVVEETEEEVVKAEVPAEEDAEEPEAASDEEEDDDDSDDDDGPPWLKKKKVKKQVKKNTARRTRAGADHAEGASSMRPALKALAEQQKVIEAQQKRIAALSQGLSFIAQAAGVEDHPLIKQAVEENPAQGFGWANPEGGQSGAEAPAATTEETLGDLNDDDVTQQGATSETDVSPDATTSLDDTGTVLDEALDLNEQDVTAPVAGTDTLGEGERGNANTNRTETEVRAGTPADNTPAFSETGWTASKTPEEREARAIATMRLARLRIQAGIADGNEDDLALASTIAASDVSDEAIQGEIETLAKVVTAAGNAQRPTVPRSLVPQGARQAQRTVPSFSQEPQVPMQTVASGPSDDEFAFE